MSNVSMIDGHIDEPKMTDKEIFQNEILCVKRRSQGVCNGGSECAECDLLMDDVAIISAYKRAIEKLKSQSATIGEEVKHGEWIECSNELNKYCSVCKKVDGTIYEKPPFCKNCGAKMDGKKK